MAEIGVKLRTLEGGVPKERDPLAFLGGALPSTPFIRRGQATTVGDVLASVTLAGHTLVADGNYQCLVTDVQIGMKPLTAPRTIWLPDVDTFPFQDLVIADESGSCSEALTITVQPGANTGDTIGTPDGSASIVLSSPYQSVRFRRGAANLWIRI